MDPDSLTGVEFDPFIGMCNCTTTSSVYTSSTTDIFTTVNDTISDNMEDDRVKERVVNDNIMNNILICQGQSLISPCPTSLELHNNFGPTATSRKFKWKPRSLTFFSDHSIEEGISRKMLQKFLTFLATAVAQCGIETCSKTGGFRVTDYQLLSGRFIDYLHMNRSVTFECEQNDRSFAKKLLDTLVKTGKLSRSWKVVQHKPCRVFNFQSGIEEGNSCQRFSRSSNDYGDKENISSAKLRAAQGSLSTAQDSLKLRAYTAAAAHGHAAITATSTSTLKATTGVSIRNIHRGIRVH